MSLELETRVENLEMLMRETFRKIDAFFDRLERAVEEERRERQKAMEEEREERERALAAWEAALEKERRERQKALEEERRERQKALEEERRERQKALEEERRERQKALEEERRERQKALEEERRERQKALEAERRQWQKAMEDLQRTLDDLSREYYRKLGETSTRQGTLVEDFLAPSTPYVLETVFGCKPEEIEFSAVRYRVRRNGQTMEFDVLAACRDFVLIMEIKSQGRSEYVREFLERLKRARNFLPEPYRGRVIYAAFAAPSLAKDVLRFGEKHGLIMLAIGVRLLEVQNSPGFRPKPF